MIGELIFAKDWADSQAERRREQRRRVGAAAIALLITCAVVGALIWGLP